jgi:hypothetical protein
VTSEPALGPTQPPVRRVFEYGWCFLWVKLLCVMLTTHLHPVPSLRVVGAYRHFIIVQRLVKPRDIAFHLVLLHHVLRGLLGTAGSMVAVGCTEPDNRKPHFLQIRENAHPSLPAGRMWCSGHTCGLQKREHGPPVLLCRRNILRHLFLVRSDNWLGMDTRIFVRRSGRPD